MNSLKSLIQLNVAVINITTPCNNHHSHVITGDFNTVNN